VVDDPKDQRDGCKAAILQANATSATVVLMRLDNTPTPITGSALPMKQQTK
jgi:hypothetical protein